VIATIRTVVRDDAVDDEVLKERVRSTLGHYVSHSHAIRVAAADGVVTLRGPILQSEASSAIRATRHVRGVSGVIDAFERHTNAAGVPALQGGSPPAGIRLDILRSHWAPATRFAVAAAGATIAIGSLSRHSTPGVLLGLIGFGCMARAVVNTPLRKLSAMSWRNRLVEVRKTIAIDAAVGEVYAFWSLYERFPHFMSRVLDVTSSESRPMESHWRVMGPLGVPVEFDVEITSSIPNRMIAWRTMDGSALAHEGTVRFEPDGPRRTRAHVRMFYTPPAGWIGHGVASMLGVDPKSSMDEDLVRMKSLIETGHLPRDAAKATAPPRGVAHIG
jgi:uncharacterized membrane protein